MRNCVRELLLVEVDDGEDTVSSSSRLGRRAADARPAPAFASLFELTDCVISPSLTSPSSRFESDGPWTSRAASLESDGLFATAPWDFSESGGTLRDPGGAGIDGNLNEGIGIGGKGS